MRYWFNVDTGQVETDDNRSQDANVMGPYDSHDAAANALQTARANTERWDREDKEWGSGSSGTRSPGAHGPPRWRCTEHRVGATRHEGLLVPRRVPRDERQPGGLREPVVDPEVDGAALAGREPPRPKPETR